MVFRMGRKLQELTHAHICLTVQGISRAQRKIQLVAEASTKHLQNTYKIQNKLSLENQALVPIHQGKLQTSKENRVWRSARMEEFWMTENYFHEFRDGEKPRKSRLLHNYRKSVKSRQSSVLNRDQKIKTVSNASEPPPLLTQREKNKKMAPKKKPPADNLHPFSSKKGHL